MRWGIQMIYYTKLLLCTLLLFFHLQIIFITEIFGLVHFKVILRQSTCQIMIQNVTHSGIYIISFAYWYFKFLFLWKEKSTFKKKSYKWFS